MNKLITNKQSLLIIAIATAALALVYIFGGLAYITLSYTSNTASQDLSTASVWINLCAVIGYLANLGNLSFDAMVKKEWKVFGELGGMTVAFFIMAIGFLVSALNVNTIAGNSTMVAVAIGLVSLVLLYRAADLSIEAQNNGQSSREGKLWLVSFLGVLLLSIGYGIASSSSSSAVAAGVLSAIGFALIGGVVATAYKNGQLASVVTLYVVRSAGILAIASLVAAILQGIEFSPSSSLTGVQIAGAVPAFLLAVAYGVLAYATWSLLASKQSSTAQYTYTPELPITPDE
ncbi:MAG: hypothetical protein M1374_06635 [Firmicutes bacterium]|jgi:membrane protein CcdC involved in cytochrome C biogenesis|nr:hypothetical protein [Bacillota bacterium]